MKNIIHQIKGNIFAFILGLASSFNIANSRLERNPQACGMNITAPNKKRSQKFSGTNHRPDGD